MKSIVLFGSGNVATHLFRAISRAENFKIIQIFNHRSEPLEAFKGIVKVTSEIENIVPADVYLFAVKDNAIAKIAEELVYKDALMLHTSGAVPIDVFSGFKRSGVLYPLQTFSKNKEVDFKEIPICIESVSDPEMLEELASVLSEKIFRITSYQRKSIHVAAVFVSNFVNYLYSEGEKICKNNDVPFELLHPLMVETAMKATRISPVDAQTGPALRGDHSVINSHLELLNPDQQEIYSILTRSIQTLHGKKL